MDKLKMHSQDKVKEHIAQIASLFPNTLTETIKDGKVEQAIDFDILKQELSDIVVDGPTERYQFTWPDKKKSILLANAPIAKTLRPCREESVDFDTTENLYIEGDNLDALKLLQETYLGKIKLIYIDPPYNTGTDFIYEDNFFQKMVDYLPGSGQYNEAGGMLVTNLESNGRFHTDWLNMIYPRLKLSKDLLSEDGAIFISIDESEVENLTKMCNEIFSAENYINTVAVKMKNIAGASGGGEDKRLKKNIEFILIYVKNYATFSSFSNVYDLTPIGELVEQYRKDDISWKYSSALINSGEKKYVGSTVDGDGNEIKIYLRQNFVIKSVNQIMREESISESEAYYKYSDKFFQTAMPQSSIRPRVMQKVKELNINSELYSIEYVPKSGKNKGTIHEQFYKGENFRLFAWLKDVSEEIDGVLYKKDLQGTLWDFAGETKNLTKEGDIPFPNGKKPMSLIKRVISMQSSPDSIVLDFFSGSATTAHSVMKLNSEDGGKRRFIMIQIPEMSDKSSEVYEAGFRNISDLGKERIRRAGKQIKNETGLLAQNLDIGFRVLKVDSTNMEGVYYTPGSYQQNLLNSLADNIKPDRTAEDLLFQIMLDQGILLSSTIQEITVGGKKVFDVADGYLLACFDKNVNSETVTEIAKRKPYYAVFRDSSMSDDSVATNFDQIFATYSPTTVRKVL